MTPRRVRHFHNALVATARCPGARPGRGPRIEIDLSRQVALLITLAWLLRRSPTMLPIPGTRSLDHEKENLAALEIELTDAEFEELA